MGKRPANSMHGFLKAVHALRSGRCFVCSLLAAFVFVSGCSAQQERVAQSAEERAFSHLAKEKTMRIVDERYVTIERIPFDDEHAPILESPVLLKTRAELTEICETVMRLVPLQINVVRPFQEQGLSSRPKPEQNRQQEEILSRTVLPDEPAVDSELIRLLGERRVSERLLDIHYQGPVRGLLDQISAQSGLGWEYERANNTVTFAETMVKTFYLTAPPGKVALHNRLTNQNKDENHHAGQGTNVQASQSAVHAKAQIAQLYEGSLGFDSFEDTLASVKAMLSEKGEARGNAAAGTISVRDRPEALRQIARYIREVNASFERQVALKVNVYTLECRDELSASLDLGLLLPKLSLGGEVLRLASGGVSGGLGQSLGTAQAAILDGTFKGSEVMLKALRSLGRAKQVTSAGIVALNNQPAPVEAIEKTSYLAGINHEITDHGSETALTPGEVTTGFSMTITPHILSGRRLLLQYTVHLSSLEAMDSFESQNTRIQLPKVSTRAFAQKASMLMGQTLVLAGFQQASLREERQAGFLKIGKERTTSSSMIIVTIEVENAEPNLAQRP